MYICNNCGCEFEIEEAKVLYETHGFDSPPFEKITVCPNCESDDFDEALYCDCCGEPISKTAKHYETTVGDIFCEDCIIIAG